MKVTILGSGTSHGIPVIGCRCPVCTSADPKNNRTRSSIWIETDDRSIVVDTATDFRMQALRCGIDRLDAVIYTHAHADHLHGLDDTRSLTHDNPVPLYASLTTASEIQKRFDYIFRSTQKGGGKPQVFINEIDDDPFEIGTLLVTPVPITHGDLDIYGYRFDELMKGNGKRSGRTRPAAPVQSRRLPSAGGFAYLTDCSGIPEESYDLLEGVETLVLGALRFRPHATHFTVEEAIHAARRIDAAGTWFTHMCHDIEHSSLESSLPDSIRPAYDGLCLELD